MSEPILTGCRECGCADCQAIFAELLALEFQQVPPFGRLHALTVAAYGVQHPSRFALEVRRAQWALVSAFVIDGPAAVERIQETRRAANSHRGGMLGREPHHGLDHHLVLPVALPAAALSICHLVDVGVSFSAEWHEQRVGEWIRSLVVEDADAPRERECR